MRVLLINNCFYRRGGSETVFFFTADILAKEGHDVVFFSMFDDKNLHTDKKEYIVETPRGIKRITSYFANNDAAKKLNDILNEEKFDIAHAHLLWGGLTASIIPILHNHGVPIIHTVHDYRMVCPAYTFRNGKGEVCESCKRGRYIPCIINRCTKGSLVQSVLMTLEMYYRNFRWHPAKELDGLIYVSHFAKQKHEEKDPLFAETKNIVLYNCTKSHADKEKGRGNYFLYYGRLSYEKGVEMAIEAFKSMPELKLKVVGTGPLEEELKQKAALSYNIEFLGFKKGEELLDIVQNAQFVMVPSQWYENNPMTIVEAYSLGTPVIGADMGGIPEIIKEGATGFVFKHDDIDSLKYTIHSANQISNGAYFQMTKSALNFYKQNFSDLEYVRKLLNFYKEVITDYQNGQ